MSAATWLAEYYPVPAGEVPREQAVDACIRKWVGLFPENYREHGLMADSGMLVEQATGMTAFMPSADNCALCLVHGEDVGCGRCLVHGEDVGCGRCPLMLARQGVPCDKRRIDEEESPWIEWTHKHNPEPMLEWLHKAEEQQQ